MKQIVKFFFALIWTLAPMAYAADAPAAPAPNEQLDQNQVPTEAMPENMPISYKGAFAKMMLSLLVLIVLVVMSVWLLRRIAQGRFHQLNSGRAIKILERRPLSGKSILYVVQIGHKKVVIAESQLEVRAITTIDEIHHGEDQD